VTMRRRSLSLFLVAIGERVRNDRLCAAAGACGDARRAPGVCAARRIDFRRARIVSEGTRMAAEVFSPRPRGAEAADDFDGAWVGRTAAQLRRSRSTSRAPAISSSRSITAGGARAIRVCS
jgi:hypothetical protein